MAGLCLNARPLLPSVALERMTIKPPYADGIRSMALLDAQPRRLSFLLFYVATLTVEPANIVSRCNRNHDIEAVNGADIHNLTRSAFDR